MSAIVTWLRTFGISPKRTLSSIRGVGRYLRDRNAFRAGLGADFLWGKPLPILDEWAASSGSLGAYFQQDLQVARWVFQAVPVRHVDVGSRIDGFVGHLAVFRDVEVLDIRPQPEPIDRVKFHQVDLMAELPQEWLGCTDSLSCLHTIEHFGMGRYGDPIDPEGHLKGLAQLKRMIAPGGVFYLSTPIGPQRVEYNAHRIFAVKTLLGWFADGWAIESFCYVDDAGALHRDVDWNSGGVGDNFGCQLGVGIVVARKLDRM
jgi:hypothetical protein